MSKSDKPAGGVYVKKGYQPLKVQGGHQAPTSQGAPAKPPAGGSSGSKKP